MILPSQLARDAETAMGRTSWKTVSLQWPEIEVKLIHAPLASLPDPLTERNLYV